MMKTPQRPDSRTEMAASRISQRRIRIIPVALIVYTIAFIDRTNISLALPKISRDLHSDPQQAGTLAGIFFWGYLALQIPAGHLAKHWSPKKIISVPAGFTYLGLITLVAARLAMLLRTTPANPETKTRKGQ